MSDALRDLMGRANSVGASAVELAGAADRIGGFTMPARATADTIRENVNQTKGMNGGFRSFGQFCKAIQVHYAPNHFGQDAREFYSAKMKHWEGEFNTKYKGLYDDYHMKANSPAGMNETFSGQDGGALIPPEFVAQILMRLYANDLMNRTQLIPLGGNSIKIPAINETSRADGSRFGGVASYWRKEAGTVAATKPSLATVSLDLNSLMVFMTPTSELLEDTGGALETYLAQLAAMEIQFKIGDSIVNGDGDGKPKGITSGGTPCKITQAKESGQAAGTIVTNNVTKMWSRLHTSCRADAIWIYDQSIEPALPQMTVGTAGSQLAVYMPPGGLSGSPYGTLMGRPMIPVEFCQQLGTEGDIVLWSPSQYLMATKGGIQTATSMHLYFDSNQMAFRFIIRIDGKPWWSSALTPKSGGPTQSCIVTLATRS